LKKRITVSLDDEVIRIIKKEQARLLKKSAGSVSFSAVMNNYLINTLGNRKTLTPRKFENS